MCVAEKVVADLLVVGAAAQVEKVNGHLVSRDVYFLHSIIYANGSDVFLDEAALTVALDNARFAGFLVANRNQFEEDLVALHFFVIDGKFKFVFNSMDYII